MGSGSSDTGNSHFNPHVEDLLRVIPRDVSMFLRFFLFVLEFW